jgi:hypothetical protein
MCLALSLLAVPARACAPAAPQGEHVRIATESALIIWDEKTKTQHFIRRASFETKLPYFGFLVPTPTEPELAEAPDDLFKRLEEWTKPENKTRIVFEEIPFPCAFAGSATTAPAGSVQELGRQHVAGYDAVKLKADDAEALQKWLEKHGYDARPQLIAWVEPYVKAGWIITAFQINKTAKEENSLSTQAVRMSFRSDKPFFPYREPTDVSEHGRGKRLLRLFVVAGQRMEGKLKAADTQWPGKPVWANPLAASHRQALAEQLDTVGVSVPAGAWLTVFDDASSPRPGSADVFFSPSPDQSALQREPIYENLVIPAVGGWCSFSAFLVVALPPGVWALAWWWGHRRAAATQHASGSGAKVVGEGRTESGAGRIVLGALGGMTTNILLSTLPMPVRLLPVIGVIAFGGMIVLVTSGLVRAYRSQNQVYRDVAVVSGVLALLCLFLPTFLYGVAAARVLW